MYEGPIVAAREVSHRDLRAPDNRPASWGETLLGLILIAVGLPLLICRLLGWALVRDVRRVVTIAGSMGQTAFAATRDE